jgi:hypothetical protein
LEYYSSFEHELWNNDIPGYKHAAGILFQEYSRVIPAEGVTKGVDV